MRIGSLFSGAGGLDMAVEQVFGGHTVWHCENDPAASKVLTHRWPGVPNLGDITTVDWTSVEPIDALCGGFPCQDVSAAGKLAGLRHGTRTGLFANLMDGVENLRPGVVVLENVPGLFTADGDEWPESVHVLHTESARWGRIVDLINYKKAKARRKDNRDREWWHRKNAEAVRASRRYRVALAEFRRERLRLVPRAIATVLGSLAQAGYDAQWCCVSASDVGAPHRRERVFIIAADAERIGLERPAHHSSSGQSDTAGGDLRIQPDRCEPTRAGGEDRQWRPAAATNGIGWRQRRPEPTRLIGGSDAAVSGDGPVNLLPTPGAYLGDHGRDSGQDPEKRRAQGHLVSLADVVCYLPTPRSSDCFGAGLHGDGGMDLDLRTTVSLLETPSSADGAGGHLNRSGARKDELLLPGQAREMDGQQWGKYAPAVARWEHLTRPAPAPTEPNRNGNPRLSAAFSQWLMGWPDGWVTDPVIGISRNDQLRIVGNGVCPQQAVAAILWLLSVACEAVA